MNKKGVSLLARFGIVILLFFVLIAIVFSVHKLLKDDGSYDYRKDCPPLGIELKLTDFYFNGIAPVYNVAIYNEGFSYVTEYEGVAIIYITHNKGISDSRKEIVPMVDLASGDNVHINYSIEEITTGIQKDEVVLLNFPDADFYWEFQHPEKARCMITKKIATWDNGEVIADE